MYKGQEQYVMERAATSLHFSVTMGSGESVTVTNFPDRDTD